MAHQTTVSKTLLLLTLSLLFAACDWTPKAAGSDAVEKLGQGFKNINLLKEIDPDVTAQAAVFNQRIEEFNQVLKDLQRQGATLNFNAAVNDKLIDVAKDFNNRIDDINRLGLDDRSSAQLNILLGILDKGVKGGLDDKTITELRNFTDELSAQPERWKEVATTTIDNLEKAGTELSKEVASQIKSVLDQAKKDAEELATVALAKSGVELRCNADYVKGSAESFVSTLSLTNFLLKITEGSNTTTTVVPISGVCQAQPAVINLVQEGNQLVAEGNILTLYGYGFAPGNLPSVQILDPDDKLFTDLQHIHPLTTTQYEIRFNLQGIDFSHIGYQYRFVVTWPQHNYRNELPILLPNKPTLTPLPPTSEPTVTPQPDPYAVVSAVSASIRSGPSNEYQKLGTAEKGRSFLITGLSDAGTWWRIDYNGQNGYIHRDDVTATNAEGVTRKTDPQAPTPYPVDPPTAVPPTVCPTPEQVQLTSSTTSVEGGQSVSLSWGEIDNVESLAIEGGTEDINVTLQSSTVVSPQQNTVYRLVATYCGGKRSELSTIEIKIKGAVVLPQPQPSSSINTITPGSIIFHRRLSNLGDNVHYDTGISSDSYDCGIIGFKAVQGDINENDVGDIILWYLYRSAGTWWARAEFNTHGTNENWSIDTICIEKSQSSFYILKEFPNLGDNVDQDTGISSNDYACGVVGAGAFHGDINENDPGTIVETYAYEDGSSWKIRAEFNTHGTNENWTVNLFCLSKSQSDLFKYKLYSNLDTADRGTITEDRTDQYYCGVVGIAAKEGDINEKGVGDIIYAYLDPEGDFWTIHADFNSHIHHEKWDVHVLCIDKEIVRFE